MNRARRRSLLASGFAGLAAATVGGFAEAHAAPPLHPAEADRDAKLLALVDQLMANDAEFAALAAPYHEDTRLKPDDVSAKIKRNVQYGHQISDEISDTPAHTLAGYRAKAKAWLTKIDRDYDGELDPDPEQAIAVSLCHDLLSGAAS